MNLSKFLPQTATIKVMEPVSKIDIGLSMELLNSDAVAVQQHLAELLLDVPNTPLPGSSLAEVKKYQVAIEVLSRKLTAFRVVSTNCAALGSKDQIMDFFTNCDFSVISQIEEAGADRALYFR